MLDVHDLLIEEKRRKTRGSQLLRILCLWPFCLRGAVFSEAFEGMSLRPFESSGTRGSRHE